MQRTPRLSKEILSASSMTIGRDLDEEAVVCDLFLTGAGVSQLLVHPLHVRG